jgi:hypothetical protein
MNTLAGFYVDLVQHVGGNIEDNPQLLLRFLLPIWWIGVVLVLLALLAYSWPPSRPSAGRFRRIVDHAVVLYAGVSLLIISLLWHRVFGVHADGPKPEELENMRTSFCAYLSTICFLWAAGLVLVGNASAIRALCSLGKGPQRTHNSTAPPPLGPTTPKAA